MQALASHLKQPRVADIDAPVRACHRYIHNQPSQFDYHRAATSGLPIGSGQVESAHRYIIQETMKTPNAWSRKIENTDKILGLREARANGDREEYGDSIRAAQTTNTSA